MPDILSETGPIENPDAAGSSPDAAAEAVRERAAEVAAEEARAAMAQVKREESQSKKHDGNFAHAFLRFLQSRATGAQRDDAYLEILVNLLDRNVPSSFLLASVGLLDDEAATAFRESIDKPSDEVRSLATLVETQIVRVPDSIPDSSRVFQWVLLLILAVDTLDAEARLRLTAENREADLWIHDLFQATLLLTVPAPNELTRLDADRLASAIQQFLHQRPLPHA